MPLSVSYGSSEPPPPARRAAASAGRKSHSETLAPQLVDRLRAEMLQLANVRALFYAGPHGELGVSEVSLDIGAGRGSDRAGFACGADLLLAVRASVDGRVSAGAV